MTERRKRARQLKVVPAAGRAGRSHPITYRGRTQDLFQWCDELGLARKAITSRLSRGWPLEKAFETPTSPHASADQITERHAELYKIVEAQQPMTVRGVFYQAEVFLPKFIEKTPQGYKMVQADLAKMRKAGDLPYDWIVDNTRRVIESYAFDSVHDALTETAENYRVNLWKDMDCVVQVWLEKDALAGVIENVTLAYGVPLMVARGYSSLSFLYEQAEKIEDETRPVFIYLLGDHDPSGVNAHESIEASLREMAPDVEFYFERLAVTPKQIKQWHLPTRPTKEEDSRAEAWGDNPSVELDAIEPNKLRKLVKDAINRHMTDEHRAELRENEVADRVRITKLAEAER